jgi:hypothetical protein
MPHCDLCEAVELLLDGTLQRFDDGLRHVQVAQAEGPVDLAALSTALAEQRVHILATVAVWWVRASLTLFQGDVTALENCLANAFLANGITAFEPHDPPTPAH